MSLAAARRLITDLWIRARSERGDVPGWVLVTLMTAGLVATIWALADKSLTQVFNDAIDSVKKP